jgi:hypothetical protein
MTTKPETINDLRIQLLTDCRDAAQLIVDKLSIALLAEREPWGEPNEIDIAPELPEVHDTVPPGTPTEEEIKDVLMFERGEQEVEEEASAAAQDEEIETILSTD